MPRVGESAGERALLERGLVTAGAKLVDVRTKPEVLYVGRVPGSLLVEWQTYPGNAPNPDFLAQLSREVKPGETLMFLCRSGQRSP